MSFAKSLFPLAVAAISVLPVKGRAAVPKYLVASVPTGLLSLNTVSGAISFCPGTSFNGNPNGRCTQIGTFTSLSPTTSLLVVGASNYFSGFVINTTTGVTFVCAATVTDNGAVFGKCKSDALH